MIVNYIRLRAPDNLSEGNNDFDYIFIAIDDRIIAENTALGADSKDNAKHDELKKIADSIAESMALEIRSADIDAEDAMDWMHLSHVSDVMRVAEDSPEDFLILAQENLSLCQWSIDKDNVITDEMYAMAENQEAVGHDDEDDEDKELPMFFGDEQSAKKAPQSTVDDLSAAELIDLLESSDEILKLFAWTKQDATDALKDSSYFDEEDMDLLSEELDRLTGSRAYFESLMLNLAIRNL